MYVNSLYWCRWHADSNDSTLSQFRTHPKHTALHTRNNNSSMCYLLPFSLGNRFTDEADLYGIFGKTMTSWSYWKQLPWLHSINTIIQHPCNGLAEKQNKKKSTGFLLMPLPISSSIYSIDSVAFGSFYLFMRNTLWTLCFNRSKLKTSKATSFH